MSPSTPPPHARGAVTSRVVWDAVKTPLTLLALLLVLYLGGRWGWKAFNTPIPPPPPVPCASQPLATLATAQVKVNVYNGSTERGRAAGVAANLKSKGFSLGEVTNTEERIGQTIVRGGSAEDPQVLLVAGFFTNPKIEADGRITGTVDVLVGPTEPGQESNDWAGMNADAPVETPVPHGAVCLPVTPTPTAHPS